MVRQVDAAALFRRFGGGHTTPSHIIIAVTSWRPRAATTIKSAPTKAQLVNIESLPTFRDRTSEIDKNGVESSTSKSGTDLAPNGNDDAEHEDSDDDHDEEEEGVEVVTAGWLVNFFFGEGGG